MEWIESKGGPLVVLPQRALRAWKGVTGGDYGLACAVPGEVGLIAVDGEQAVVLGGEPHRTYWWPTDHGGMLVRWISAESERELMTALGAQKSLSLTDSAHQFSVPSHCRLIDAADTADFLQAGSIAMDLSPGAYRIETGYCDLNEVTQVLIHRFARSGS